ncbi:ABC-type transport auxiliary lipoprotein family protein [uncultured Roseobacter sp.]|uniref:ABC-type transport auxiliary lipoprotein family protein n=2 Tax=uncultured Roseobacter sp. TaxID=114847 RepID=UPI00262157E3|nr:ABC-type transport auxiliary lipoprotein family protein [uncultured Roseobacter sp.]
MITHSMKWMRGLLLLTMLAGCTGLASLTEVATPTDLYVLSPKSTFSASLPQLRDQIVVNQPTATAAVDTDQIAVQPTPLQVQYLPGARWVDRAPLIVQALLIESFENTGKVPAVGSSTIGLRADYLIVTDIREFQAIVPVGAEGSALQIDVRLNIKIIDAFSDRIIGSRSFEEIVPAASDTPGDVTAAFDEALGDTMRDAIEWSIREIARHAATSPR